MPTNYSSAVDEMFGIIFRVWDSVSAIVGYTPQIRWPGQPMPSQVPMDQVWVRPSTQIVTDGQSALANADSKKKYHAVGLLYVQVFCPRTAPSTLDDGRKIAQILQQEFRKESPSGVIWFRDQKVVELPSSEENYPINVAVTFEYDEIGSDVTVPLTAAMTRHFPNEAPDGIRVSFTFPGLPDSINKYMLFWDGLIQSGFAQNVTVITLDVAPKIGDELYAFY